ncbi:bifunctional diaminohydroxyphosphoribosylaminopyrimidine deaminase/5-amino-6-(5-phosphoribosylamino)uracil reductase RibD, partial [Streptomyces parvus]|nr:bifunctional diaminohydroxyphosphoribosylaminopyrimidine deaminase/5-amino-6-(5-phosphoribosylamino)uracil reductase RibD [Streptomyces parvus]
MDTAADNTAMRRAITLAARGLGSTSPNPVVGCVITDAAGAVAGEGFHQRAGGPHAEVHALRAAGDRARGGTAYVTLEPCNHTGRTGPCAQALLDAGISRVVYAVGDPNPQATGGG